jgi:hypothetical protein
LAAADKGFPPPPTFKGARYGDLGEPRPERVAHLPAFLVGAIAERLGVRHQPFEDFGFGFQLNALMTK